MGVIVAKDGESSDSKVDKIIICNIVLIAVATFGTTLRVFVRVHLGGLGLDDLFCGISWAFLFAQCFISMWMTKYGYGRHYWTIDDVTKGDLFLKLEFATNITYRLGLAAIKIAFCLSYLRIFPGRTFRILCWGLAGFVAVETIVALFVVIFHCSPIHKAWDASGLVEGTCFQLLIFYYISFGIKLATDIALFTLPIPNLIRLKIGLGKRLGLVCMFGLGVFVIITSIVRVTFLNNFNVDISWELVNAMSWSSGEMTIAIVISCIPSLKGLINTQFPRVARLLGLSSIRGSTGRSTYGTTCRRGDDGNPFRKSIRLSGMPSRAKTALDLSPSDSEENILPSPGSTGGIEVRTSVSVHVNRTVSYQSDNTASHPRV
ncbi:integral membrane protein [Aspergillus coremiiformis]|uniref:Integral membrane protein n=1 Tax=Aspergillus coremiiformis TaxID=138285 RepID=A0A5N6Z720_9EURO|nr:integral membrane protein [Aspergillus coremiiformis]